jgi:hemolysin activation/secretion protein
MGTLLMPIRTSARDPRRLAGHRSTRSSLLALVAVCGLAVPAGMALAQGAAPVAEPVAPAAQAMATPGFPVSGFVVGYRADLNGHPGLPTIPELMDSARVELAATATGFDAGAGASYTISELSGILSRDGSKVFTKAAVERVMAAVSAALNDRGIVGVWVDLSPNDIQQTPDGQWRDSRPSDRSTLTLSINVATVSAVRTVAGLDGAANEPRFERIRERSPVQSEAPKNLLERKAIEEYVAGLNRHPGRRVDVAVGAGEQAGTAALDYMVTQDKPWTIYFQVSNTGTESTNEWRQRFGFVHNQLTNNDDILSLDYVTGGFEDSHAFNSSYEFPFFFPFGTVDKLRMKVFGGYNEFDASEVGGPAEAFEGEGYNVGAEFVYQLAQWGQSFLDVTAGARYQHVKLFNSTIFVGDSSGYFLPRFGLNYERFTQTASSNANIAFEFNMADLADTKENQDPLGRTAADDEFAVFQWNLDQSFYLEPILDRARFEAGESTLAHEIGLTFRGQASFDDRLIPTFQQVIGGFYSVRGYEESEAAGDTVFIFNAEYRLHIPRLFAVSEQTVDFFGPFRTNPGPNYIRPDWDLIVRAFFDVGHAVNVRKFNFEDNQTLAGTGIGAELQLKRNLNVRVDWGIALEETTQTDSGDSRVHFVATLLF